MSNEATILLFIVGLLVAYRIGLFVADLLELIFDGDLWDE